MAGSHSPVSLGPVSRNNLAALRRLNTVLLPVRFSDKYYRDVLSVGSLAQLAYYKDVCVGAVTCFIVPLEDGGEDVVLKNAGKRPEEKERPISEVLSTLPAPTAAPDVMATALKPPKDPKKVEDDAKSKAKANAKDKNASSGNKKKEEEEAAAAAAAAKAKEEEEAAALPPGPKRLYITTLGVLAPYRRLGIGKKLIDHVTEYAKSAHPEAAALSLHVSVDNEEAIEFYKKLGFSVRKELKSYYIGLPNCDALYLWRDL
ncbi:acyl-CoA N-acyltransferase [Ramicandelaber brevisporus]|nr:acyl-CoA N-acyltransferase [Ramicandelaber brevisporus]